MIMCGCALSAVAAQAQEILERFSAPLPVVEELERAAFEEATALHEETPGDDEVISYSVRLPKTWKLATDRLSNYSISNRLLGEVARYYGPSEFGSRSRFTVEVLALEYQVSAQQWFLQHVLASGYTLQGMKVHNDRKVEAILVKIEKDTTYIVRAVAQINGKRIILAQYSIVDASWPTEQGMQAASVGSFELKTDKVETIEEMLLFQFLDIAEFKYPKTWDLRAPPLRSIDRMLVKLSSLTKGRTLNGQMELHLVSTYISESLDDEIDRFRGELEEKGLLLGKLIEKKEGYEFDEYMEFALVDVYAATDAENKMLDYELWITTMSSGSYYYFLTLLTPSRNSDFFVWSRNTETYKLVVESVAPQEESLVDE